MVAHSKLGASISKRFMSCPGSVRLCASLPEAPGSEAASEGTFLHALTEHCLRGGECDAKSYEGLRLRTVESALGNGETVEPADGDDGYEVTREHVEAVNAALDHVWDLANRDGAEYWTERRFSLEDIRPGMFGTNDASVLLSDGTLHVIDYKYGRGVAVEVEDNSQLLYYALGAVRQLHNRCPEKLVLTIIQPRCAHPDGPIRSVELDLFGLLEFESELRAAVEATDDPNAPLVPGQHCRFCPGAYIQTGGKFSCPAFDAGRSKAMDDAFAAVEDPPSLMGLSPEEMGKRYSQLAILRKYIDEFDRYVKRQARVTLPEGYEWAPGRRSWKWNAPDADVLALVAASCSPETLNKVSRVCTPIQAEKALGAAFAEVSEMVDKSTTAPQLMKKGSRKKTLTLEEVNAFFEQNHDAAFDVVE